MNDFLPAINIFANKSIESQKYLNIPLAAISNEYFLLVIRKIFHIVLFNAMLKSCISATECLTASAVKVDIGAEVINISLNFK